MDPEKNLLKARLLLQRISRTGQAQLGNILLVCAISGRLSKARYRR
jgi:hypothetical protein